MSKSGQWINNVKEVIRVTLVGIDPSDQVQIKGYLRILLRVDFDIEWVSPKNPKVDLFIVNQAFSNSDSVKSLINESQSPVLYVAHVPEKSNVIENNTLYLKLEHVAILESWLNQNVPRIYETYHADKSPQQIGQFKTQVNEDALRSRLQTNSSAISNNVPKTQSNIELRSSSSRSDYLSENCLTLLNTLNNVSSESYYELSSNGKVVAVIKPKERLIWPKGESFFPAFDLDWSVNEVSNPLLEVKHAMNLNTWIWLCALEENSNIIKILPLDAKLSLKTWPKPKTNNKKSDYLRILAMTELQPLSVHDISRKTNISIDTVHKCMSALYMGGFMDTGLLTLDVYAKQQVSLHGNNNVDTSVQTKDGQLVKSKDELEDMINTQIEKKLENNYMSDETPAITKDKQVGGLLSRIRATLGF